jgi:tellurite resistance protein
MARYSQPVGATTDSEAEEPREEEEPLPPGDLTAESVFRLLLVECLRDGKFSRAETRAVVQVRDLLGLSLKRHAALLEVVQADFDAGKIPPGEEMDPLDFFEACYRGAIADGVVTEDERGLLGKLSAYLHLTRQEFQEIKVKVARSLVHP